MSWHLPCFRSRPWRNLAYTGALGLLLAAGPLPASPAPPDFNRLSGILGKAPETSLSFSMLYEENRELAIGNFITVDLLAHAVTRLWHDTLPVYETETVGPRLAAAAAALLAALAAEPDSPATVANRDFARLILALLAGQPNGLSERAAAEYQLVHNATGEAGSLLFGYRLDYSQFLPRAAYAESEARQRFFRAYRYAATALFPLVPSAALGLDSATGERLLEQLKQLARLNTAPKTEPAATWLALQASVTYLLPGQVASVDWAFIASEPPQEDHRAWGLALLQKAQQQGRQPQVLHAAIDAGALERGLTPRDVVTGYRFAPLLEATDSRVFQRLVYNATEAWQGKNKARKPLGLGSIEGFGPAKVRPLVDEWVMALDVDPLLGLLKRQGETAFANYPTGPDLQKIIAASQGLEGQRVKLFTTYLTQPGQDWEQRVETVKGLWTEFKHAELLYQAQSYTATGKGITQEPVDPAQRGAMIEAAPQAIQALQAFSEMLARQVPETVRPRWSALHEQLARAATLAAAQAAGTALTSADEEFLRTLPKRLDQLAGTTGSRPLVVDVHTGIDGREPEILHAAIGFVRAAVVKVDEKTYRGARYRFFSFTDRQRWTDEQWRGEMAQRYPEEGRAWRIKVPAALVAEVVLARASREQKPRLVSVVLADESAPVEAWTAEHQVKKAQRMGGTALLELPLALVPRLAEQPWVTHIALPPPPFEPLQSATVEAGLPAPEAQSGSEPPVTVKPE